MRKRRLVANLTFKGADLLARFEGPVETIAASVPRGLIDEVRARVGKREFSRFVAEALAAELISRNRLEYVSELESIHGPVDQDLVAHFESAFSR